MNIATITKDEIITRYQEAADRLPGVIKTFNDEIFNSQPFEGSWTAGQVAEHLYKSVSGIPGLLISESRTTERDPLEKCETISSIFLNFEVSLKSPDFILPSNEIKQVDFFVAGFENIAKETTALIDTIDLDRTFTRFPFPTIGELTGWEWIWFTTTHTIRHTRQLKNIREHF